MLLVNLPVVNTGVMIKATGDSKLDDSPGQDLFK